jgi:TP901 family phage tail tape measure protein
MADEILSVGIEADASDAVRDMRQAADAAASLADSFREIASVATSAARALTKAEQGVTGTAKGAKASAQAVQSQTAALRDQADAADKAATSLRNLGNIHTANGGKTRVSTAAGDPSIVGIGITKQERESLEATAFARQHVINMRNREIAAIRETVQANIAESRSAREAAAANKANADALLQQQRQNVRRYAQPSRASGNIIPAGLEVEGVRVGSSFGQIEDAAIGASHGVQQMRDSLFTARFALHDISNATGIAGAALLGFNALTVKAAADYETAMAAIQRTSGATTSQMATIQDQFVDLAQTVPAGFQNLAQIGELAGQLNIPAQNITKFTETVAQFTSSTDVAVQQSAEAFGRLDALLPDVQGNYEALGSSILNVGVNSVATESAIISTTTQIAAAGAQARFSADEIIGLAASYASLGVAPEAARGSTIRIFSEISTAVQQGGSELEEFARLSGQSASEFSNAWTQGDASQAFLDFLKGLQDEGTNAETVLRNLGITGVRDINALLRLSQNLDIVTQSFGYAGDGFTQATQLADAFGLTSETLNARLDLLGQSIQALFAELGSTGTGPIKEFVNGLIDLIKFMTELSRNPVAQWVAVFGGLFTLLAGGVLVLTSIAARMGAMAIATRTVNHELRELAVHAATSGTAMGTLQSRVIGAGIAMTQFSNIMKGLAWGTAITAGLSLILLGIEAIGNATQSAGDKAKEAFGDLSGLSNALMSDTRAYEETGKAIGFIEGSIEETRSQSSAWVTELESATGAQTNLGTEVDHTAQRVREQTFAIGENTSAWLANQLANNETVANLIKYNQAVEKMGGPTVDVKGAISAAVKGDTDSAMAILEDYRKRVEQFNETASAGERVGTLRTLEYLEETLAIITGSLDEASAKVQITTAVMDALGVSSGMAAMGLDETGNEASDAASQLDALRSAVDGAFGGFSTIAEWGSAIEGLFTGLASSGVESFMILGGVGETNLSNLQQAIITTIAAGQTMGVSAVDSVAALFSELQRQGIDTANLMASLASIPGIGAAGVGQIKQTLTGTRQLTGNANALQQSLSAVATRARQAASSIGGGGGGGGGKRSLGGAAASAAKEVRTLVDYASDLDKVFSRAFEIRFSAGQGMDKINTQWLDMKEAIADANAEIREAQANMAKLTSDNNILAYFKTVADSYGDNLRSADISAEIAQNNEKLAEEQKKAAEASDTMNKNLTGNTRSAIENRGEILELVGGYQDLIKQYASSGMSQAELAVKTQELKAEFLNQGVALGYSYDQLLVYASGFDDVALAIQRVPRNVTVAFDPNPALQALRELEAQAARSGQQAGRNYGGGFNGAVRGGISPLYLPDPYPNGYEMANKWKRQWNEATSTWQTRDANTGQWIKTGMQLYKDGGYTGGASPSAVAGLVHGQEFVVNADNTRRLGLPFLNALNNGKTPTAVGAVPGIQVVELSATDRALLAAAGNVSLTLDGRVVAQATNGANFVSTKRGSN